MKDKNNEEMELCLCPTCASTFYATSSFRIYRKDLYQVNREICTFCNVRLGYDFLISQKSSVQNLGKQQICTLELEAENE